MRTAASIETAYNTLTTIAAATLRRYAPVPSTRSGGGVRIGASSWPEVSQTRFGRRVHKSRALSANLQKIATNCRRSVKARGRQQTRALTKNARIVRALTVSTENRAFSRSRFHRYLATLKESRRFAACCDGRRPRAPSFATIGESPDAAGSRLWNDRPAAGRLWRLNVESPPGLRRPDVRPFHSHLCSQGPSP
jgi:hypothetical protein